MKVKKETDRYDVKLPEISIVVKARLRGTRELSSKDVDLFLGRADGGVGRTGTGRVRRGEPPPLVLLGRVSVGVVTDGQIGRSKSIVGALRGKELETH